MAGQEDATLLDKAFRVPLDDAMHLEQTGISVFNSLELSYLHVLTPLELRNGNIDWYSLFHAASPSF